ncbi:MAG: hypothetical protein JWQ71_1153 [Pedosphaera sp.]|nr:hypothetical protein [Pedosphaera sp.]
MKNICLFSWKKVGAVAFALLISAPMLQAQHGGGGARGGGGGMHGGGGGGMHGGGGGIRGGGPGIGHPSAPAFRPESVHMPQVERIQHGSIRHSDAPVIRREQALPGIREQRNNFDIHRHVDVDVDRRHHFWGGFLAGAFVGSLPLGYETIVVNGAPYNYYDGVYYQQGPSGYMEVYPPVGAAVIQPPDGSIPITVGNQTYYYAGGAFYVQQGDQFVIVPTPIGVVVPELPPGANQVVVNGQVAYQFNGIYYRPVFVNGVTEYQTSLP